MSLQDVPRDDENVVTGVHLQSLEEFEATKLLKLGPRLFFQRLLTPTLKEFGQGAEGKSDLSPFPLFAASGSGCQGEDHELED